MLVFVSLTLYVVTLAGHNMAASVGSVVVFGSTGQTGSSAVAAALKKGLKVTAFVRDVSRLPAELVDQVTIVQGDATVKSDVERAVRRHDAVVVALGTRNNLNATTVMSDGLRNVLDVMLEQSVNKVSVCLSSFIFWDQQRIPARFAEVHADHLRMLDLLRSTKYDSLNWIAVLPPQITSEPASGAYAVTHGRSPGRTIPKWDLGHFMVEALDQEQHYHKLCGLAYPVIEPTQS